MQSSLLIGLDIGTTNVKAAAYRENGERIAQASETYPTFYPHPGWAEQRPSDWRDAIETTLKRLVAQLGDGVERVTTLGISAHAPSLIPVDASGDPLVERIPIWQDERSLQQAMTLLKEIGAEWVGLGMPFAAFAAKLRWFTEKQPDLAREARYALGTKSYLLHWLTGKYATDPSSEPGQHKIWATMCEATDWSLEKLVPVLPAREIAGRVRTDLTQALGFREDLAVVVGLNDGASATLGNGALRQGDGVITLATNGVIFLVSDTPISPESRLSEAMFCWPYLDDRWVVGGQTKTGASSLQWLNGLLWEGLSKKLNTEQMLLECANTPAGSQGVLFYPYLMGRGTPKDDPTARGGFTGLSIRTDRANLTHAVLEGVTYTLREVLETLTRNDLGVKRLRITGGGAQSEMWLQMIADVLNRPLSYSDGDSCLGAAMLAAVGAGVFPDIEAALMSMKSETQEVQPRPEIVDIYARLYAEYIHKRDAFLAIN